MNTTAPLPYRCPRKWISAGRGRFGHRGGENFTLRLLHPSLCSNIDPLELLSATTSSLASFVSGEPNLERSLQNGGILRNPPFLPGPELVNRRSTAVDILETLLWLALDEFCTTTGFVLPDEVLCLLPPPLAPTLDMAPSPTSLSPHYPATRRQSRLSYVAPALLENMDRGAADRQQWLAAPGTRERLGAVLELYEKVNTSLRHFKEQ